MTSGPGEPFRMSDAEGALHPASGRLRGGLVLAHGAGSDRDAPLLTAAADAFSAAGWCVLRIDLPFRRLRPKGPPPKGSGSSDREGLRRAVAALRERVDMPIALGGHSYGGRQATLLAAEAPEVGAALLLLSYPLHPPRKPEEPRTAHFPRLRLPAAFLHGARDAFGSPAELERAAALIPAPTKVLPVPGAGHDLRGGRIDFGPAVAALAKFVASA